MVKFSITFLKFFFTRIYFNTIHHGSFVFCVLSSQRVTLKYRKDKEIKNIQETRKQKMTKKTKTTQHPSIPGGSNYKIKGEFFTTLFGLSKQTWPILFQGAWLQNEVSWSLPPPSPPEIKNLLLQIILCYLCHYVLLEYWSHQQKNSTYIYCNAFCNLVLLWATKKPFPIEPRKPSINSRFYLYGYYSNMFYLSYIFSILSYYKYICL